MRVWADSLAGVAGLEWEPVEVKPYGNHVGEYVDEGTVPATSPYKRVLDFRPVRGKLSITISGTPATLIEWGTAPSGTGVVAVDWVGGQLEFAAADAGAAVVATLAEHYGTVVDSGLLNSLQSEIAAAQAAIAPGNVYTVGPAGSGAQYATVQAALDAIPAIGEGREAGEWAVVRILPGRYLTTARFGGIHVFKDWISFEGANRDLCVIEKARVDADGGTGEFIGVDPFAVDASHIRISGLTIRNIASNWPGIGLALTINPYGGKGVPGTPGVTHTLREDIVVRDCNLVSVGGRDTVFVLHKVDGFLMEDCYIEGSSDIVALFSGTLRNCHVHCIEEAGPHAAMWLEQGSYGGAYRDEIVVERCTFTGVGGVCAFNLTRGTTTAVDCVIHGAAGYLYLTYGVVGVPRTLKTRGCTAANFLGPSNAGATVVVEELKTSGASTLSTALTAYVAKATLTAKGAQYVATGPGVVAMMAAPANGRVRVADSAQATGWADAVPVRADTLTAKGSLLAASAASTPAALAVPSGAGPWILRPNAGATTGLEWIQRGVVANQLTADDTLWAENGQPGVFADWVTVIPIPANALVLGSVWRARFSAVGYMIDPTAAGVRMRLGSIVLLGIAESASEIAPRRPEVTISCILTVRSTGTTGTLVMETDRLVCFGTHSAYPAQAALAVNTTVAHNLSAGVWWDDTQASNYARLVVARLERLA